MAVVQIRLDKASVDALAAQLGGLVDDETMLYAHHRLAAYFDPYIPKETGTLSQSTNATSDYLEYYQPYAHYQWAGFVYGPNIPIYEDGVIVGWFSIPGRKKTPTGALLTYSHEVNPQAGAHWDQRMMAEKGAQYAEDVARYIAYRFNGGGGP